MTLLLGMVNPLHAVLISDRRLTLRGRIYDDESSKMLVLTCGDARLALAYTGLAAAAGFEARQWLLKTLMDGASRDTHIKPMLEYLKDAATTALATLRATDKRFSVMCVGYRYDDRTNVLMAMVSNYDGFGRGPNSAPAVPFTLEYAVDAPGVATGNVLGAEIRSDDYEDLKGLLRDGRVPAAALVGKSVAAIRRAAAQPSSRGFVGRQCLSVILPADRSQPVTPGYHSETVSNVMPGMAYIDASKGPRDILTIDSPQLEIRSDDGPIPLAGPRLQPTAPCWCRSGKHFRNCHGRH